jgi:hypothetical protein
MAEFIRNRQRVEHEEFSLHFDSLDIPGAGFGFPCDKDGNVFYDQLQEPARENLKRCLSGLENVGPAQVERYAWTYIEPAAIRCEVCGSEVELDDAFASGCPKCGTEYNGCGQQLAPRSQWGDEWTSQPEEDYGLYVPDYSDGDARQP